MQLSMGKHTHLDIFVIDSGRSNLRVRRSYPAMSSKTWAVVHVGPETCEHPPAVALNN